MTTHVPARLTPDTRTLTAVQFEGLADVPPELEWFANIWNPRARGLQARHPAPLNGQGLSEFAES